MEVKNKMTKIKLENIKNFEGSPSAKRLGELFLRPIRCLRSKEKISLYDLLHYNEK